MKKVSRKGAILDGTYILRESALGRPHQTCRDNCIYWRAEDSDNEYCFQDVDKIEAANIQCDALNTTKSTTSKEIMRNTTTVWFGPSATPIDKITTATMAATVQSTQAEKGTNKIPSTEEITTIIAMAPGILLQTAASQTYTERLNYQEATTNNMYTKASTIQR